MRETERKNHIILFQENMLVLDQIFDCPFCNHEKSCEVTMDKERNTGRVQCTKCFEDFQVKINFLSEPIDVYNVDGCEAASVWDLIK